MKLGKFIGMTAVALALSLVLCGCGDKKSKSESKSDSESASSSSQTPGKFSPMVTKDATSALGVNLDKRQAFKVVDAYLDQLCDLAVQWGDKEEDIAKVKTMVSRCKKDLYAYVPWQLRDFLDETGLRDAELRWAVISLEDVDMRDYARPFKGLAMAMAGDINLEKLIPKGHVIRTIKRCQEVKKDAGKGMTDLKWTDLKWVVYTNDIVFTEMSLEGEKAWCIKQRESKGGREPLGGNDQIEPQEESAILYALQDFLHEREKEGIVLHVTSLDGQLLLAASSRGALAKQIRLYRQGKGAGDLLGGFSAKKGELLRLKLEDDDIGEIMGRMLDGAEEFILRSLMSVEAEVTVSSDGTLSTVASLKVASEEDADKIRALAKVGLMKVRSQCSEDPYMPRGFVKMLDAVKIDGADGEIKVQNVNPLLFWPRGDKKIEASPTNCVSGKAKEAPAYYVSERELNTMAMNGRKLIMGIVQANIERPGSLPPLWPRTWQEKDASNASSDDVSARAYRSAADYFNALFDMEHYGTSEWDPAVDGELLSTLGKNAVVDGKINPAGLDWCIAANIVTETEDFIPVLISANVNPELLYGDQFDGMDSSPLPIGPKSGAPKSMFGDQGIVLVRKGGAAESYKIKFLRYNAIYYYQSFDYSGREHPIVWLTPTGVAVPGKGKRESQRWPQK